MRLGIHIQSLHDFSKAKKLDGGVADRRLLLHHNKRLYIIQVGSDDSIEFFGVNR